MLSRSFCHIYKQCGLVTSRLSWSADIGRVKCSTNSSDIDRYDVVITGGGMVGAALTAALATDPLFEEKRILLLEAGNEQKIQPLPTVHSSRTCALSSGSVKLLDSFGAWDNVCTRRMQPVKRMQIWDSCSDAMIAFNQDNLMDDLAYIVENNVIVSAIYESLKNCDSNVEIRYNTKADDYHFDDDLPYCEMKLSDGSKLRSKLIIGADGFKSHLRESVDIHTVKWNYNQMGVVATLKIADDFENSTAWQRFLPNGPIAMLPLSSSHSCLIWSTTPDEAKQLLGLTEESFVDAVNDGFWSEAKKDRIAEYATRTFDSFLTTMGLDGSSSQQLPPTVLGVEKNTRGAFPLGLCHATHYVKNRVALIGDAAHRLHPLAGQGVNLGFGDVTCLHEKLSSAVYNGYDIGSLSHLMEYEKERQKHVVTTTAAVDGLNRLYSTSWTPLVLLRSLGCQTVNSLSPLKARMIGHAGE